MAKKADLEKLKEENKQLKVNLQITEKHLAQRIEDIQVQNKEIAGLTAIRDRSFGEVDRLVRIVDQFLSVQITPLGTKTESNGNSSDDPNSAAKLRRT